MSDFVDSVMSDCFQKNGSIPEGSKGTYDHDEAAPFSGYTRTPSPNGVREKFYEGTIVTPSGESDQF